MALDSVLPVARLAAFIAQLMVGCESLFDECAHMEYGDELWITLCLSQSIRRRLMSMKHPLKGLPTLQSCVSGCPAGRAGSAQNDHERAQPDDRHGICGRLAHEPGAENLSSGAALQVVKNASSACGTRSCDSAEPRIHPPAWTRGHCPRRILQLFRICLMRPSILASWIMSSRQKKSLPGWKSSRSV